MKKNSKKMIMTAVGVTAAASAGAAAAAYLATRLLVRTALDRNQPKIMKNAGSVIAGSKKNEELDELCRAASERLKAQEHENVEITGYDGVALKGHFFPCEDAERIIIAFHGWRSSWDGDFGLISDFWHKNKCSVLYVEQRGQNDSGGEYMSFGLAERFDCVEWSNWAVCRCGKNLPIYLAGISMGAGTILMAADLPLPNSVHGIMADCGFTSPKAIWKYIANKNLHMPFGVNSIFADIMCRKRINMHLDEHSAPSALRRTDIPVLFVHGSSDHFVPVEMTYENYLACASPKRLLIVPGAEHAMSYLTDRKAYEKAVKDFWREFD